MTVPSTDDLDVEVLSREDGVFEVVNKSHEDPSEHTYRVFCDEEDAYHCTCPAFEYGNGLDENGNCKHMRIVEQFCRHLEYRDWQIEKKEREEELRRKAMEELQVDAIEDSELPRDVVAEGILNAVLSASRDGLEDETDDESELSSGAQAAQEMLEEGVMKSTEEWRNMSSEGRERYVAML